MRRLVQLNHDKRAHLVLKKVLTWFANKEANVPSTTEKKVAKKRSGHHKPKKQNSVPAANTKVEGANVIARNDHPISRKQLSPNALKVLYRLKDSGYDAYLVGGCIRDILLGLQPKDFDIATNATPEQVKRCFNNCRVIGRRFKLAHVMFGREIIEVATFRGHHSEQEKEDIKTSKQSTEGQLLRDNVYGTIEEDAERRDFTINALYYNIKDFTIYDFANGVEDIKAGVINLIGDPETRYREDPVRMLRAVRFSTKLRMQIAERTEAPMFELAHLLRNIPPARLFDESLKLFLAGKAQDNYRSLREYGLFRYFFPVVDQVLSGSVQDKEERFLELMFANTDTRINNDKSVSPAFIMATLLWYPLETHAKELEQESGLHPYDAFQIAMNDVLHRAVQTVAIPKRFTSTMREIWQFQHRLTKTKGKRPAQVMEHPRFRAAYDFLLLRAEVEGGELEQLADWWTEYQESDEGKRASLTKSNQGKGAGKGRSRRRYSNRKANPDKKPNNRKTQ